MSRESSRVTATLGRAGRVCLCSVSLLASLLFVSLPRCLANMNPDGYFKVSQSQARNPIPILQVFSALQLFIASRVSSRSRVGAALIGTKSYCSRANSM